jgi:hypothetical protein
MKRVNNRMTNRMKGEEWYNCDRCYSQRPRSEMIVQNGRIVCVVRCVDEKGYGAYRNETEIRTEESPDDLPEITEDL